MAQADEFTYLLGKTAFMSSGKYLLLVKKLIENCNALETGTLDTMMNEGKYKEYADSQNEIPEGKSDARSLIPFVYSVYNSVEQMILGFYYVGFPDDTLTFVPTFERLEAKFDENDLAKDEAITSYVHKYTHDDKLPALLKAVLDASEFGSDHLKGTRRALENNNLFNVLDMYQPYYFSAEEGKAFFAEVYEDTNTMLDKMNMLVADIDDDGSAGSIVTGLKVR